MSEFAKDIRSAVSLRYGIFLAIPWLCIHMRLHIGKVFFIRIAGTFKMNKARGILLFNPFIHFFRNFAAEAFVAEAPAHNAGAVFIAVIKRLYALHARLFPFGARTRNLRVCAVALHIIFINNIKAVFIAKLKPAHAVGIVRGAHGIDVVLLHKQNIFKHGFLGHNAAEAAIEFVAICALKHNPFAVYANNAVFNFNLSEAEFRA